MRRRKREHEPGTVIYKGPCDACGSSDARAHYDNGTSWCFSGNCREEDKWGCDEPQEDDERPQRRTMEADDDSKQGKIDAIEPRKLTFETCKKWGKIDAIEPRKLTFETCKKWGYEVGDGCQIANYRDEQGELVAQKIRAKGKKFFSLGPAKKNKPLYGIWLWPLKAGQRSITITESV